MIIEYADDNAVGKIRLEKIDSENKEPLAGATFDVIAAEDILTPDGTVRASKDTVVDTLTTDENGMAESKELYLGKYLVRETGQPDGYLLLQKDLDVELTYKDQDTAVVVENLEVANKPTDLIVRKQDKDSKERLAGVKFSICPKEEHGKEGHKCKTYVTDKNGEIEIKRLAPGTYLIQEVKGLDGYSWDTAARKITIDKNGQIDEKDIGILTVDNAKTEITKTSVLEIESKSQVVYPKEIEAVDTVSLKNLQKGETYTLIRELRDVETGELLFENNDVDYNHPLRSQKEFEATDSKMDVEMDVSFDATEFAGRKIVVFEELYQNGQLISEHTDLKDEKQQLTIKNPKLHTTATDQASGTHEAVAKKNVTINDEVRYEDIIPGTYLLKGIVMDKKTKKPLRINGKRVISEKEIEIKEDGTVKMEFTFDATKLNNRSMVIFEYLYAKSPDGEDDELIASHEDINDEGQTVRLKVGGLKANLPGNKDSGVSGNMKSGVKTGDQAPTMFFMFLMAGACVVAYQMRKKLAGEPKSEEEKN